MTAPWLARTDWAERRIRDTRYEKAGCVFKGTLVLFAGAVVLAATMLSSGGSSEWPVLFFPLFTLIFVAVAYYGKVHQEKFGTPVLEVESVPIRPGAMFAGFVRSRAQIEPEGGFHFRLRCLRKVVTGSGKNKRTSITTLWASEMELPGASQRADGIALPVAFEIPIDATETDTRSPRDQVVWELEVKASLPGVDFGPRFELPVFREYPSTFDPGSQ